MLPILRIIALSVAAAVTFGLVMDQITVRICVEYFTIAHPRVMESEDPTLLALYWGVVATWWVGLPLGVVLAVAARAGQAPKWTARDLFKPILVLLGVMAVLTATAGGIGYIAHQAGAVALHPQFALHIPADRHARFMADAFAHLAAYATGGLGGLTLAAFVALRRRRRPSAPRH